MSDVSIGDLPFTLNPVKANKLVGYAAFFLPLSLLVITQFPGACAYFSISHYYYSRLGSDIFVGILFFIGLMMLFIYSLRDIAVPGFQGFKPRDIWAIRIAGLSAFGIALSPTTGSGCFFDGETARAFLTGAQGADISYATPEEQCTPKQPVCGEISFDFWGSIFPDLEGFALGALHGVHFASAALMFLILAYISISVFRRKQSEAADENGRLGSRKQRRNMWYLVLGLLILLAVAAIGIKSALVGLVPAGDTIQRWWDGLRLTFWFETLALVAFGLSWMIKGRFIDFFEDQSVLDARAA